MRSSTMLPACSNRSLMGKGASTVVRRKTPAGVMSPTMSAPVTGSHGNAMSSHLRARTVASSKAGFTEGQHAVEAADLASA